LTERKTTSNSTVVIGVIGLIVMLAIFEAIRELWQKGTSPLRGNPWGYVIFVVVFVVILAVGYLIHKRYKT
jgi:ABC-type polysaccharide/polyol phosphate export permease